ncbi:acetolactate synthase [Aspergillus avenaceus]|uniref:acetolactate synthase n=1 Tax=Aspergillus avenaceus TaxID=36643 RepID=A0A5N6TXK4_ASPAV|nr:acetolactate synthase [Aspergillus avenaceus]
MEGIPLKSATGGEILLECLAGQGVNHVFAQPGASAMPLFQNISKSPDIRFISSHHERGAVHMAEGYAKATRKPAVVLLTTDLNNPDAARTMLDDLLDNAPLVIICCHVAVAPGQALSAIGIFEQARTRVKWSVSVQTLNMLPAAINMAFQHSQEGQPGPVLISVSSGIAEELLSAPSLDKPPTVPLVYEKVGISHSPPLAGAREDDWQIKITYVANMINHSRHPVICAGNGVLASARGCRLVSKISQKALIPVATTLLGLGSFDETREEALHMVGTHGALYGNFAIQNADLIIVIGARLDENVVGDANSLAPNAVNRERGGHGIVHFDIDSNNLAKVIEPTQVILGDLSETLPILLSLVDRVNKRPEWLAQIRTWKKQYPTQVPESAAESCPHPQQVMAELNRQTTPMKSNITITTGIKEYHVWASQHFRCTHPHSLIGSDGVAAMGFSLPAAIGAKLALPQHQVIAVDSDISVCTTIEELFTALREQVEIKAIVFNNGQSSLLARMDELRYRMSDSCDPWINPDFDRLARRIGCQGQLCERVEQLPGCIFWLLRCRGPALLDVATSVTDDLWTP